MRNHPVFALIEPLESRIAPANIIYIGGPGNKYTDAPFYSTDPAKTGSYDAADQAGANFVGGTNTYYIKLVAGDVIKTYGDDGYKNELIHVNSGTVIAFFTDLIGPDNGYQTTELTGISFGKNANLVIKGSVNGDIVGNYNDGTGKIEQNTLVGATQGLGGLSVDNVHALIAGGNISNVTGKNVAQILAGNAANGLTYDFNASDTGGGATLSLVTVAKQAGANISKLNLSGADVIRAGDGGEGAAGGSIQNIALNADSDGFLIQAGSGGAGGLSKLNGGVGGSVASVYAKGTDDFTANSPGFNPVNPSSPAAITATIFNPGIQVLAGTGGAGYVGTGTGGSGGGGGSLNGIYVGYEQVSGKVTASDSLVLDSVLLQAGDGGASPKTAGAGGSVGKIKVLALTPDAANPNAPEHEVQILGGNGGAGITGSPVVSGGKSGAGGSLSGVEVRLVDPQAFASSILLQAGDGGANWLSTGGAGGSVTGATLVGYNVEVIAGNGANATDGVFGKTGGNGGGLSSISMPISTEGIIPRSFQLQSGSGGGALAGNAGNGGAISSVGVEIGDFDLVNIITGVGGISSLGKGGNGGSVKDLKVTDIDLSATITGGFTMETGDGGDGKTGAGSGGGISSVTVLGDDLFYSVTSGKGGNASEGNGGKGGAISSSIFSTSDTNGTQDYSGSIVAGAGGTAAGKGKTGGAGGDVTTVTAAADGDSTIQAGDGGQGIGKTAGKGGSVKNISLLAQNGSAVVTAGNAGYAEGEDNNWTDTNPGNAGAGGSITTVSVLGSLDVTVRAGNGAYGGAGGSITALAYSGSTAGIAPLGVATVQAGAGSVGQSTGGGGGSLSGIIGYLGDGLNPNNPGTVSLIGAGDGVGSYDGFKAGAGGSISGLIIHGGGNHIGAELRIQAGNAGNALLAKTGAKGGNVSEVAIEKLGQSSILRFIAAGEGGAANATGGTGGAGGSISDVSVIGRQAGDYNGDIGVRSGLSFGLAANDYFDSMGGLIAGAGGMAGKNGVSGSVIKANADAIASIVAGRLHVGDVIQGVNLASKVSKITLNEVVVPTLNESPNDGSFSNWESANMVGAVIDPLAAGANLFELSKGEWIDTANPGVFGIGDTITAKTDGFIAAVNFPADYSNGSKFSPQALLTVADAKSAASASNSLFIDNDNKL